MGCGSSNANTSTPTRNHVCLDCHKYHPKSSSKTSRQNNINGVKGNRKQLEILWACEDAKTKKLQEFKMKQQSNGAKKILVDNLAHQNHLDTLGGELELLGLKQDKKNVVREIKVKTEKGEIKKEIQDMKNDYNQGLKEEKVRKQEEKDKKEKKEIFQAKNDLEIQIQQYKDQIAEKEKSKAQLDNFLRSNLKSLSPEKKSKMAKQIGKLSGEIKTMTKSKEKFEETVTKLEKKMNDKELMKTVDMVNKLLKKEAKKAVEYQKIMKEDKKNAEELMIIDDLIGEWLGTTNPQEDLAAQKLLDEMDAENNLNQMNAHQPNLLATPRNQKVFSTCENSLAINPERKSSVDRECDFLLNC